MSTAQTGRTHDLHPTASKKPKKSLDPWAPSTHDSKRPEVRLLGFLSATQSRMARATWAFGIVCFMNCQMSLMAYSSCLPRERGLCGEFSPHFMPTTIEWSLTKGLIYTSRNPIACIQPMQSAPLKSKPPVVIRSMFKLDSRAFVLRRRSSSISRS